MTQSKIGERGRGDERNHGRSIEKESINKTMTQNANSMDKENRVKEKWEHDQSNEWQREIEIGITWGRVTWKKRERAVQRNSALSRKYSETLNTQMVVHILAWTVNKQLAFTHSNTLCNINTAKPQHTNWNVSLTLSSALKNSIHTVSSNATVEHTPHRWMTQCNAHTAHFTRLYAVTTML